jgi:carboxymethylenebutenolidase
MLKQFILRLTLLILSLFLSSVSPHDSFAAGSWVTYQSGADTVRAYLSVPTGKGPFPALIVIHEWWGLNDWVKEKADEFAEHGYIALAIDLYRGRVASSPDEAHELSRGLPEDRAARDLRAAAAFLRGRGDVARRWIGSIGWCMGGGYSLEAALTVDDLAACVVCYGRLVTEPEEIRKISCPVFGVFGGEDRGIPPTSVHEFEKSAKGQEKDVSVAIYPKAGHAFMNPNNTAGYRAEDAKDAWNKIYAFLDRRLKSK